VSAADHAPRQCSWLEARLAQTLISCRTIAGDREVASQPEELQARLAALQKSIAEYRDKLKLHGRFSAHQEVTEKELRDRWDEVQKQVSAHGHDSAKVGESVLWLEKAIDRWVTSTDLDFK
jgi:hypothetical protein